MGVRKLKPIEERDPYAALVLDAFDRRERGEPMLSEQMVRSAHPTKKAPTAALKLVTTGDSK